MPALNEGSTIKKVIESLPKSLDGINSIDVLVVDDGSSDHTVNEAASAGASVISHRVNKGVGAAFATAVSYAIKEKYDALVSIDADGQFNSSEIANVIAPVRLKKSDFVLGTRFENGRPKHMSLVKFYGNKLVNFIISRLSGNHINDASCGFRAYSREALLQLNLHGSFTYTHETILDLLNKNLLLEQIPIEVSYFPDRKSRVASSILKYGIRTSRIIFKSFKDYAPFYFFLYLGLFFLIIGIVMGSFVLYHWMLNGMISPYKSFGIIALGLVGIFFIFLLLALVADMLSRIRINQERILYLLKSRNDESTG